MIRLFAVLLTVFWTSALFAKIAGVPNDLRREFKSVHKFKEVEYVVEGKTIKARLDTAGVHPVLLYEVPKNVAPATIFDRFVYSQLAKDVKLQAVASKNKKQQVYQLQVDGLPVEDSWVKLQEAEDEKGMMAYALNLPVSGQIVRFAFPAGNEQLTLHNGRIFEFRTQQSGGRKILQFPETSGLPERQVVNLTPKKGERALVEKFPLARGSFPDQIVVDENDHLWFTQPSDSLLTRFDPVANLWENIAVGGGADGLYLSPAKKFWFGEYFVGHLGMYDAVTKEYKRWAPPYENPVPAIPFEDENGRVWTTDHERNKISQFNTADESWKIFDIPSAGAWAVQVMKEPVSGNMFVTECYANKIGKIEPAAGIYSEIELGVSTCPAFMSHREGKLWISLWSEGSFLSLDVNAAGNPVIEYEIQSETGIGPVGRDPQGRIYFGGLTSGRVYRFDPATEELVYAEGVGGLKDGLAVDSKGHLWVTEMSGGLVRITFE